MGVSSRSTPGGRPTPPMLPTLTLVIEVFVDGVSTPIDTGVTITDSKATKASKEFLKSKA